LAEETERNKDDVTHLDMLKQHYEEREKAYEVSNLLSFRRQYSMCIELKLGSKSCCC